jgi:hypothetical protein
MQILIANDIDVDQISHLFLQVEAERWKDKIDLGSMAMTIHLPRKVVAVDVHLLRADRVGGLYRSRFEEQARCSFCITLPYIE